MNFCQSRMMISKLWPKQGILGFRQFRSMYNFTDRLNKIYKIYHQSPSITEKMCMQTSVFIGKNNNLEFQSTMQSTINAINIIPLIIIQILWIDQHFLWKYCKHQRQARWIQRRMPIRKVGVRSHTWSFKNVSIRHENTNTVSKLFKV